MGRSEKGIVQEVEKEVKGDTQVKFVAMDLGDLESARKGAVEVKGVVGDGRIDVLILNAGIVCPSNPASSPSQSPC